MSVLAKIAMTGAEMMMWLLAAAGIDDAGERGLTGKRKSECGWRERRRTWTW